MIISGLSVYTEKEILPKATVCIKNGIIDQVLTQSVQEADFQFPDTFHLVPGFIDLHVHGVNQWDVMDATPESLMGMSQALAREGTTAFLATTMTAAKQDIENALKNVRAVMQSTPMGAKIMGVHLEGPFISPNKVGAQSAKHILLPQQKEIEHWQAISDRVIKLVTLAPELAGSLDFIRYLQSQHIIPAMGHTNATYTESLAAIAAGCHYATHLFNAMRGIHQREPGIATAALLSDAVWTELIVDGLHLHPAIVNLIFKLKTADKMVLVTDAMRAKCMADGQYDLGGQPVFVNNQEARLRDGTLAGSLLKLPTAIVNLMRYTSCDLPSAIKMASANPAKILGLFAKKGSIAVGKDADLVVLDEQLNVVMTICEGRLSYHFTPTACVF